MTAATLRRLSYAHSSVYAVLLWASLTDREALVSVLGWVHGLGWIGMAALCLAAVRRAVIPLWLGVMVAVIGGIGPFAGSAGFWWHKRRADVGYAR